MDDDQVFDFQTRICPTCHDDHSSETACDINDLFQMSEIRKELDALEKQIHDKDLDIEMYIGKIAMIEKLAKEPMKSWQIMKGKIR